jgi:hypothetical protein
VGGRIMIEGIIKAMNQTTINLLLSLLVMTLIVLILMFSFNVSEGVYAFKNSCESYGGSFWELANVTCSVGAPNCRYMCSLNDEQFSMSDLGDFGLFTYSRQICIKDCEYVNKQEGRFRCVC